MVIATSRRPTRAPAMVIAHKNAATKPIAEEDRYAPSYMLTLMIFRSAYPVTSAVSPRQRLRVKKTPPVSLKFRRYLPMLDPWRPFAFSKGLPRCLRGLESEITSYVQYWTCTSHTHLNARDGRGVCG